MNWLELQQASLDDIVAWANSQPWCRAMANCGQDAEWHSEGDVWTHTKLVCRQLVGVIGCKVAQQMPAPVSVPRTKANCGLTFHRRRLGNRKRGRGMGPFYRAAGGFTCRFGGW
jgi:hypothetical protein